MSAKAYLVITLDTTVWPIVVVGASTYSAPLSSLTATWKDSGQRMVEIMHVKAGDYAQAVEKLLRMVQGLEHCPFGDLRGLWPFLDPSKEGHDARFRMDQKIRGAIAVLPRNPGAVHGYPPYITQGFAKAEP